MKEQGKLLRERIYQQLVNDILLGRINAGEKLVESELAVKFNVSRTPVREVLIQLDREGYTDHVSNLGSFVRKISKKRIKEIYEVIAVLESEATKIAIENKIQPRDILSLQQLQQEMIQSAIKKEFKEYNRLNLLFHRFFLERCGNATLVDIDMALRNKMYRLVTEGLSIPTNIDKYLRSHDQIIEAVVSEKPVEASRLMKEHIRAAGQNMVNLLTN